MGSGLGSDGMTLGMELNPPVFICKMTLPHNTLSEREMTPAMEERFLQNISITSVLEVTLLSLLLSCCHMAHKVIPASGPFLARAGLPEILWNLFILVKGKTPAESAQLRPPRIKMWHRI